MGDPSDFETELDVHGEVRHSRYRVLMTQSSRCRIRSRHCCFTAATRRAACRTFTSSGPRATQLPTSCDLPAYVHSAHVEPLQWKCRLRPCDSFLLGVRLVPLDKVVRRAGKARRHWVWTAVEGRRA